MAEAGQLLPQVEHILYGLVLELTEVGGSAVVTVEALAVEAFDHVVVLFGTLVAPVEETVGERTAKVQVQEAQDGDVVGVGLEATGGHDVNAAAFGALDAPPACVN